MQVLLPLLLVIGLAVVVAVWVWLGFLAGLVVLTIVCIIVGVVIDRQRRQRSTR